MSNLVYLRTTIVVSDVVTALQATLREWSAAPASTRLAYDMRLLVEEIEELLERPQSEIVNQFWSLTELSGDTMDELTLGALKDGSLVEEVSLARPNLALHEIRFDSSTGEVSRLIPAADLARDARHMAIRHAAANSKKES